MNDLPIDALSSFGQFGWAAIVFLVVRLIIKGDLVPRKYYDEVNQDRTRLRDTNDQLIHQNAQLTSAAHLSTNAVVAIAKRAGVTEEEGQP